MPRPGERVKRGAVLATLDDAAVRDAYLSARSAVRSAESALEVAKRNQERSERLEQAGAVPERDLETARLNATNAEGALEDARARLAAASKQLEDTRVRAPFDGVVSERHVDAGDVVQVGAELYTIVDPRRLRLEASVPANELDRLKVGAPVEFTVSGSDRRVTGQIDRINPVVDPTTRQVRIYASVPNGEQVLRRRASSPRAGWRPIPSGPSPCRSARWTAAAPTRSSTGCGTDGSSRFRSSSACGTR